MMRAHYADLARRWVLWLRPDSPPRLPADRRRLVGAVEQALRGRARHRVRVRRVTGLGAVAAALALVTLGGPLLRHGPWMMMGGPARSGDPARALTVLSADVPGRGAMVVGGDTSRPATRGMMLEAGIELVGPAAGDVRIGTAEGTALTLEPGGNLTVTEATTTQRFALRHGAVRVQVAKLRPGQRFVIDTADAEIEVHGTAFRVAMVPPDSTCSEPSATRVSVTEGVVTVRSGGRETRVLPGQEWPTGCGPALRTAEARHVAWRGPVRTARPFVRARAIETREAAPSGPALPAMPTPAQPSVVLPPPSPSMLAAQNDLFAAAMRAKHGHRNAEAVRLLTSLVRRYPQSPLAESALAQRMKLMATMDPIGAGDAAAEYLARFPGGFARADAQMLSAAAAARP